MAAEPTGAYMGDTNFALTDTELAEVSKKDPSFYNVNLSRALRTGTYFTIPLMLQTAVGNTTSTGIIYTARFPFKVFYAELGCEAAAGSTATAKIQKALAADTATYSTLTVSASTDIKTAAPALQGATIDADKADIAYGDVIRLSITGASGGNVTGGMAILHCVRL